MHRRRRWATGLVAWALALAAALIADPAAPPHKAVRPFLVYYGGVPQGAGAAWTLALARRMRAYPVVVFGWALRTPPVAALLARDLSGVRLYGYVDTGYVRYRDVEAGLASLARMHYAGVLLDDVGIGLSARRGALQRVVDTAYRDHLNVLLNAWDPATVAALRLRAAQSAILCENWVFSAGAWHAPRPPAAYTALRDLQARGLSVYMIVTARTAPVQAHGVNAGVRTTVLREFGDYLSVSGPYYSARTNAVFPASRLAAILGAIAY